MLRVKVPPEEAIVEVDGVPETVNVLGATKTIDDSVEVIPSALSCTSYVPAAPAVIVNGYAVVAELLSETPLYEPEAGSLVLIPDGVEIICTLSALQLLSADMLVCTATPVPVVALVVLGVIVSVRLLLGEQVANAAVGKRDKNERTNKPINNPEVAFFI